jgi:hypothetical protein
VLVDASTSTNNGDGLRGRDERVRDRDHPIARAHTHGLQRDPQGVRPGAHADCVLCAAVLRERLLERHDLRAAHELAPLQQCPQHAHDVAGHLDVLRAQVHERDLLDHAP